MQRHPKKMATPLFLMMWVFILPVIAGWILYYYHDHFSLKTVNHGTLFKPPFSIESAHIVNPLEKKWRILYVYEGNCDNQCKKISHDLQQMHLALGKEYKRATVVLLNGQLSSLDTFKSALQQQGLNTFIISNKIYLIDPINNIFMYYPSTTNPMNILKDLKKVLEVSQIG